MPGSVDENDKQMDQWNLNPPVLYLWSRPAWTLKHRTIARKQGHLEEKGNENKFIESSGTGRCKQGGVSSVSDNDRMEETKENSIVSEGRKGSFSRSNSRKESPENQENRSTNGSRKRQRGKMPKERCWPSQREKNVGSTSNAHSRKSSDMSLDADVGVSNYQPQNEILNSELEIDYASGLDGTIEDIGRTYGLNNDGYYSRERLPNSLSPHPGYR